MRRLAPVLVSALLALAAPPAGAASAAPPGPRTPIRHLVYLLQGARTFDNLFGTFPGADGPPAGTCLPRDRHAPAGCVAPFALHGQSAPSLRASGSLVRAQLRGRMDGFVAAFGRQGRDGRAAMGYYDERDVPFSWQMAREYVLFDRFFSAAPYGIRLNRSYWVAAAPPPDRSTQDSQPTIFDRLQAAGVSWKFYIEDFDPTLAGRPVPATDAAAQARIPLLSYARFARTPALRGRLVDLSEYYRDLARGTLPAVAYIATSGANERTARSLPAGQRLVRSLVTQLMASTAWSSSALLWSYDGGGGWYDHVPPPVIAGTPAGLRVPALLVSPYARAGRVDHTQLDPTSALRFIEDNWSLDPLTGRDATAPSLEPAFDFAAPPRPATMPPVSSVAAPVVAPLTRPAPAIIYAGYGGALLAVVVLFAFAAWRSAPGRRRHDADRGADGGGDHGPADGEVSAW